MIKNLLIVIMILAMFSCNSSDREITHWNQLGQFQNKDGTSKVHEVSVKDIINNNKLKVVAKGNLSASIELQVLGDEERVAAACLF